MAAGRGSVFDDHRQTRHMEEDNRYRDIRAKLVAFVRRDWLFVSVTAILLFIALIFIVDSAFHEIVTEEHQEALGPFYTPPDPLPQGRPGDIIRMEPLDAPVPAGGSGYRVLYLSERTDGTPVASSGMVFIPPGDHPESGRPVVAWAHPTVGMGDDCAPSRSQDPASAMSWLGEMLARGWVVTATDYSGLGTPGTERYLVGKDEARDVMNSVRAARNMDEAAAGSRYAVWGHSQGGHAALFTATEGAGYAPELELVGTAAAAPAAALVPLVSEQYSSEVGWVIGPEVLVSWPDAYPALVREDVASPAGMKDYQGLAEECLFRAGGEAAVRTILRQDFFRTDPMRVPDWYGVAAGETPALNAGSKPVFIAQGLDDDVVPPDTTALFAQDSCRVGVDLTTLWLGGTGHLEAAKVAGPAAADWLDQRFQGKPTSPTCGQPLPVEPAVTPGPPPAA